MGLEPDVKGHPENPAIANVRLSSPTEPSKYRQISIYASWKAAGKRRTLSANFP